MLHIVMGSQRAGHDSVSEQLQQCKKISLKYTTTGKEETKLIICECHNCVCT